MRNPAAHDGSPPPGCACHARSHRSEKTKTGSPAEDDPRQVAERRERRERADAHVEARARRAEARGRAVRDDERAVAAPRVVALLEGLRGEGRAQDPDADDDEDDRRTERQREADDEPAGERREETVAEPVHRGAEDGVRLPHRLRVRVEDGQHRADRAREERTTLPVAAAMATPSAIAA